MARKAVLTREDMVEGAFRLIRREGHGALTARSLAAELGCSTQPIMYRFPDLSQLREAAYQRADRFHSEYLLSADSLPDMGLRYIRFAAEEKPLFRFLFQSGHFDGESLPGLIRSPESEAVLRKAAGELGMPPEEAADVFGLLFAAVHGFASLVANNAMEYDPAAAEKALAALAEGLTGKE